MVPWKKIVPPPPPDATSVVLPQNVPELATVTAAGTGLTTIVSVLEVAVPGDVQAPLAVMIQFTVLPLASELVEKKLPPPTKLPFTNHW